MSLSEEQLKRYDRHIVLENVGLEGQLKLLKAKVLIIGVGGLGSPAALYLAAAGIGTIGIADADSVEISNLQRQIIHFTQDVGKYKVDSASGKMKELNPDVKIKIYHTFVSASNIFDIIKDYDFIIDGSDNFDTKFLINDACISANKPFSHGGILRFTGQTITVIPGASACYRCIFGKPPSENIMLSQSQMGVLGGVPGILGTIQATEALKFILGIGKLLINTFLFFDALTMDFRKINIMRNEECPVCSQKNIKIEKLKPDFEKGSSQSKV